jgi:hypothetical protein
VLFVQKYTTCASEVILLIPLEDRRSKMDNVIPFPKVYMTTKDRSDILVNDISLELIQILEDYNINVTSEEFIFDMAWVVKFLEVTIDNSLGVHNPLSKHIRQFVPKEYEKESK